MEAVPDLDSRGATSSAISRDVISLTKTITGRGPTKAKTYVHNECVVVLMREGHTVSEGSMAEGGRKRDVAQARVDLSEHARQKFIDIIEQHVGRKVIGFLSSSQQDPSLIAQVYVLEPNPLVAEVPEDEASGAASA